VRLVRDRERREREIPLHREGGVDRDGARAGRDVLQGLLELGRYASLGAGTPSAVRIEKVKADHAPVDPMVRLNLEDLDFLALVQDRPDLDEWTHVNAAAIAVDRGQVDLSLGAESRDDDRRDRRQDHGPSPDPAGSPADGG
jgi:hypothetical protein